MSWYSTVTVLFSGCFVILAFVINVNLTFESGNIYGLVGRNGSGKSVLLKMICAFYEPTCGEILFDGINVIKNHDFPKDTRALIENPSFLPDLTGYENLKIYQDTEMFNFSLDSVLLPNFVTINKKISKILDIGCGNAVIPMILSQKTSALITGVEIQEKSYNRNSNNYYPYYSHCYID